MVIKIHQAQIGPAGGPVPLDMTSAIKKALGGGQLMKKALQERMLARLGYDFNGVRLHNDPEAHELSCQLGATAFTLGRHIFFSQGAYDPASAAGLRLIEHELAHVVQQCTGRVRGAYRGLVVRPADDALEQEANSAVKATLRSATHVPSLCRSKAPATVIQRQVAVFIDAANNRVNPLTNEGANTRPRNCHEAVLGWLLTSMGYPRRWRLIRLAADRIFAGGITPQFMGNWMSGHIYTNRSPVNRFSIQNAQAGDILCSGAAAYPTHSMVVVSSVQKAGLGRREVKIRGFNNIGTFANLLSPPPVPPTANPPQYDNNDRDVADPRVWNAAGNAGFGVQGVLLFRIAYASAIMCIAAEFPWEKSPIPSGATPRWHYNSIQGWRWY